MEDDREEFEAHRRAMAGRLAADDLVHRLDHELTTASDRFDYSYFWNWLGVPVIQMPTDIVVMQEIIWATRPQLIIETGIARGGSIILYASILQLIGDGSVLGIDIDIRPHNRGVIESHPMAHRIRMLEGSSVEPSMVETVRQEASGLERVMVVLDSNHTHDHVLQELRAYAPMVTPGQYLVVADTFLEDLPRQEHRPRPWGPGDNPRTALEEFLAEGVDFLRDDAIGDKLLLTSSPGGYLRRR